MFKRTLSCLTVLALLVASAVFARADDSVKFDELKACRKVFAYSGSSSAYFYGFYDKTVMIKPSARRGLFQTLP